MEKFSRSPSLKKDIADINEEDLRVQILGTIIEYVPGNVGDSISLSQLIISDGTGNIKVFVDDYWDREYKVKEKIRVFGTLIPNENKNFDLNAEIIQNMDKLDIDLYKKVRKIRKNDIN